ncbi:TPA: WD repeat-containing protein 34 [Trebouxia sp. C0005]
MVAIDDGDTLQVNIQSTWQLKRPQLQEKALQTSRLHQQDQACQSGERNSKSTQTDRLFKKYSDAVRGGPGLAAVVAFLNKVVPLIEVAIAENGLYTTQTEVDWTQEAPSDATLTHTLHAPDTATSPGSEQTCCTSVSWSSTGQGIAVSYGRFDVEGWCLQPGRLCTWNLARTNFDPNKPEVTLEVDSCLQCCAYHPQQAGLIAGGSYTGDVYVWDLSQEGDFQVFKSTLSASSHQEPVTAVSWHSGSADDSLHNGGEDADVLISLGSDGRLLMWRRQTAELLYGFELMWQHPDTRKMVLWGGTCMALPQQGFQQQPLGCLVGSEGGAVFRCSLDSNAAARQAFAQAVGAQQKGLVGSAIKSLVCQHAGPVHALSASPFDPNLALSCGLDGQARICSILLRQPLLELAPSDKYLFAAQWSPTRPMVIAIGTGDGRVFLYDLMHNLERPVRILDVCGSAQPVYGLVFNVQAPELFATTDQQSVKVWNLQEGLTKQRAKERQALNRLVADATAT